MTCIVCHYRRSIFLFTKNLSAFECLSCLGSKSAKQACIIVFVTCISEVVHCGADFIMEESTMITEQIGMRIREIRNMQGISQEKLAFKADLDRTYLAGVELGRRNPSVKSLEKILQALDISFEDFFKGFC